MERYAADYQVIRASVLDTFPQLTANSACRLAATGQAGYEATVRACALSAPPPERRSITGLASAHVDGQDLRRAVREARINP